MKSAEDRSHSDLAERGVALNWPLPMSRALTIVKKVGAEVGNVKNNRPELMERVGLL
jgi:hypothetical protein